MLNPSAFPVVLDDRPGAYEADPGMTLRYYFAAKAMEAMIAKSTGQDRTGGKNGVALVAAFAFEYADAMLAARQQS